MFERHILVQEQMKVDCYILVSMVNWANTKKPLNSMIKPLRLIQIMFMYYTARVLHFIVWANTKKPLNSMIKPLRLIQIMLLH